MDLGFLSESKSASLLPIVFGIVLHALFLRFTWLVTFLGGFLWALTKEGVPVDLIPETELPLAEFFGFL